MDICRGMSTFPRVCTRQIVWLINSLLSGPANKESEAEGADFLMLYVADLIFDMEVEHIEILADSVAESPYIAVSYQWGSDAGLQSVFPTAMGTRNQMEYGKVLADSIEESSFRASSYNWGMPTAIGTNKFRSSLKNIFNGIQKSFSLQERDSGVKEQKASHLGHGRGPRIVGGGSVHSCLIHSDVFERGVTHNRYGSLRKVQACPFYLGPPGLADNNQSCWAELHRAPSCLDQPTIVFSKNRHVHRHKSVLTFLTLITCPSFASAALPVMAAAHLSTLNYPTWSFSYSASSLAQSPIQLGGFTCAALALLVSQRTNPHLKYFAFLGSGFLITVCIAVDTEAMLDLFPWAVIGTLLVSSLFYGLNHRVCHLAGRQSPENLEARTGDSHNTSGSKRMGKGPEDNV